MKAGPVPAFPHLQLQPDINLGVTSLPVFRLPNLKLPWSLTFDLFGFSFTSAWSCVRAPVFGSVKLCKGLWEFNQRGTRLVADIHVMLKFERQNSRFRCASHLHFQLRLQLRPQ